MAYDSTDVAITDKNSHVYAIMRMDGSQRWVNTALTYRSVTSPAFLDKYVIVGDYEGYLYFLDNATGEICGMFELDSSGLYVNIAIDNDVAYILSRGGDLYAVKVATEE
jgi:outer membrane protein assembly factor BamB